MTQPVILAAAGSNINAKTHGDIMAKKQTTEDNFVIGIDEDAAPVNHVQTEDNYELPAINMEVDKVEAEVDKPAENVDKQSIDLTALEGMKTYEIAGIGFELDYAIDRYINHKDKAANLVELKYRVGILAADATGEMVEKVNAVRKLLG